jgi:hypothetical protein
MSIPEGAQMEPTFCGPVRVRSISQTSTICHHCSVIYRSGIEYLKFDPEWKNGEKLNSNKSGSGEIASISG